MPKEARNPKAGNPKGLGGWLRFVPFRASGRPTRMGKNMDGKKIGPEHPFALHLFAGSVRACLMNKETRNPKGSGEWLAVGCAASPSGRPEGQPERAKTWAAKRSVRNIFLPPIFLPVPSVPA
jgi:hypothetical protein